MPTSRIPSQATNHEDRSEVSLRSGLNYFCFCPAMMNGQRNNIKMLTKACAFILIYFPVSCLLSSGEAVWVTVVLYAHLSANQNTAAGSNLVLLCNCPINVWVFSVEVPPWKWHLLKKCFVPCVAAFFGSDSDISRQVETTLYKYHSDCLGKKCMFSVQMWTRERTLARLLIEYWWCNCLLILLLSNPIDF